ncbi:cupin domain-containing protein [Micromonospora sp. NBC_01796]|uniref:cupin domain-containing protein n=1 Tax=Micromonospora sp. NBC_01796 TaxID=2975987 RepID=UPI002DD9829E|nr:cupin domain-containing protein [Micromonospora sp. NBC_01796]WSA86988.1 cupin domain-containing protein [Micromonospora sp. NBC_01796]
MPVIRHAESRRTETPNAIMTTLASPTQGGAGQLVWRVDMGAGQAGPLHGIDTEQVWTVLTGAATVELADEGYAIEPGDTLVIPADVPRRITAAPDGFTAVVVAPVGMRAYRLDAGVVARDCAVPDGDKVIPAWVV